MIKRELYILLLRNTFINFKCGFDIYGYVCVSSRLELWCTLFKKSLCKCIDIRNYLGIKNMKWIFLWFSEIKKNWKKNNIYGPNRVRTGDLLICSQMLYYWAMDPFVLNSIRFIFYLGNSCAWWTYPPFSNYISQNMCTLFCLFS